MAVVGQPVIGQQPTTSETLDRFYSKDAMHGLAEQFAQVAQAGLTEGADLYSEPSKFFMTPALKHQMKQFFINESFHAADPEMQSLQSVREHNDCMAQLFENDLKALMEASPLGAFNPVVGLTFPMHKNLLMTTVFDKGAIPKDVAATPQFTLTMETRTLFSPDGREIDMFLQQDQIKDIVEASVPRKDLVIGVPEDQTTDILDLMGVPQSNRLNGVENLSRATRVTKLIIQGVNYKTGDEIYNTTSKQIEIATADGKNGTVVIPIEPIHFVAAYGQYDRTFQKRIFIKVTKEIDDPASTTTPAAKIDSEVDLIFQFAGSMHKNRFTFMASEPSVIGVVVAASLDSSSAMYETPKVKWSARTDFFEIPDAPHITVTISPEETRDIQAMYNVNQLTKLLSMIKLTMVNYKDDKILEKLDESWLNLPKTSKVAGVFDFIPEDNYMGSHVAWRYETFMDYFDLMMTYMLQVLNDENVTFSIFGSPQVIRRLTPTQYSYATPDSIGPVMLDYKKTITQSDNRVYQFISSNKLRNDNTLIIVLNPRNSTRVMYKIFDYQLYCGNEIRDTINYQLPAVTCFERFLFVSYQPLQARIRIVNTSGLEHLIEAPESDGFFVSDQRAMNEYTSTMNDYNRATKTFSNIQIADKYKLPAKDVALRSSLAPGQHVDVFDSNNYVYAPNYAVSDPSIQP